MKIDPVFLGPAATLAAALVAKQSVFPDAPRDVAQIFFDVLEALQAEAKKRVDPPTHQMIT